MLQQGLFYSHCQEKGTYTGPLTQLREAHLDMCTLVFWKGITLDQDFGEVCKLECCSCNYNNACSSTNLLHVDILQFLITLADQLDRKQTFGDHTVTFISEYKNRVTK